MYKNIHLEQHQVDHNLSDQPVIHYNTSLWRITTAHGKRIPRDPVDSCVVPCLSWPFEKLQLRIPASQRLSGAEQSLLCGLQVTDPLISGAEQTWQFSAPVRSDPWSSPTLLVSYSLWTWDQFFTCPKIWNGGRFDELINFVHCGDLDVSMREIVTIIICGAGCFHLIKKSFLEVMSPYCDAEGFTVPEIVDRWKDERKVFYDRCRSWPKQLWGQDYSFDLTRTEKCRHLQATYDLFHPISNNSKRYKTTKHSLN